MKKLNEIVKVYLERNGIKQKFFSNYIGVDRALCTRWLNGERQLQPEAMKKVHDFLGNSYCGIREIMKEEERNESQ